MKFLHTSDLHIGKKLFELSMLEEQKHALNQICAIAVEEAVETEDLLKEKDIQITDLENQIIEKDSQILEALNQVESLQNSINE